MTIQSLLDKLSSPNQKRVAYGIYWSINKMNKIGTKATSFDGVYTFSQWVSYTDADFIITKLDGFSIVGRKTYEAQCNIDGLRISVKYYFGMINRNAKIDIEVIDIEKLKKEAEEKQKIENENKELVKKVNLHMINFIRENRGCTDEQYNNELSKFDEKHIKLFLSQVQH
jgi:hypothetical protein